MTKNEKVIDKGQFTDIIDPMNKEIVVEQAEDLYESLFDYVPCIITVQDKNYRLIKYNREFQEKFDPIPGDYCYQAYKGRTEKCPVCPVEKTFEDGQSHSSEETGYNKDGTIAHWVVRTTPVRNSKGEIVAVMELNLDITHRRQLEQELEKSERKYHDIFNNIPNPVFVLDVDTLEIIDCNPNVEAVYEYSRDEMLGRSFLDMFSDEEKEQYLSKLKTVTFINRARQATKDGKRLLVNIRVSPSEYHDQNVLLVTTSDITKLLETEQQLIQASKMATLGEMSTGLAHELNQPLSVIKTASNFFMRKIKKKEKIDDNILVTMAQQIDSHVDRATRIINHMREFGRESDMSLEKVQVNEVLGKACEVLNQQLKLKGIEVIWELEDDLPMIKADPGRLEQVFINLLINARDAIEDKWETIEDEHQIKKIVIKTISSEKEITAEISDTGIGIPEVISEKIFEPFFTTKKVGKGTGLGLSISYGIIKECGGSIKAETNRSGGADFVLTFPRPDEQ
ncbi:MAG: PAS domain S-box protein [Deltaproteobacteria bacterium]|nr:PAS domain S-box protein [Deltaproteobacteria bacterium]MBW2053115.1 PAS domain S-box protein [Deltaproteobacteria bacterium]MBW2141448.1 PAS domain S-box protein [Deltaproteobacteria bacterium]MBW2322581.1 PAS domain S-box protein [Deltaproteobacteria bacterium]